MPIIVPSGCGGRTPIKELALPPVTIIEGEVSNIDKGGFFLKDNSGSIYVNAELPDNKKLNIFDGYVIKNSSDEKSS